jgi:hypothetical protein
MYSSSVKTNGHVIERDAVKYRHYFICDVSSNKHLLNELCGQ